MATQLRKEMMNVEQKAVRRIKFDHSSAGMQKMEQYFSQRNAGN